MTAGTDSEIQLEGGELRQLHVSRDRIVQGNTRPLIVEHPKGRLFASRVDIEGPSSLIHAPRKQVGGATVYVETRAPLRVFYPAKS